MKKFIVKFLLFLFIPFVGWTIVEALLPITTFTHRHFEAVDFSSTFIPTNRQMYPNVSSSMNAVGDMCHHTGYAVIKHEVWKTDKLGFRNNEFVEEPDILFLGDSFFEGTGLSQEELLMNNVKARLNNKVSVYNMAASSFTDLDRFLKTGMIKKPKLIIFDIVERNTPPPLNRYVPDTASGMRKTIANLLGKGDLDVYLDKATKQFSLKWLRARIHDSKGYGTPGINNCNMFFFNGVNQKYDTANLQPSAFMIKVYRDYCEAQGIKFIFLPMPNKETVYYDLVPFDKQPNYTFVLDSMLRKEGVKTINTLALYNDYRKTKGGWLYHLDDTHWNANATALVADEIARVLRTDPEYKDLVKATRP